MRVWRISNFADLSGKGGLVGAGRWHEPGNAIVYTADHPASALLEMLVHVDKEELPESYQLLEIHVPDETEMQALTLPSDWREQPSLTRSIGLSFLAAQKAPVLPVPSVIVPFALNYLLNPARVEAAGIAIVSVTRHPVDRRLLR